MPPNIEMMSITQSPQLLIESKDLLFTATNRLAQATLHSRCFVARAPCMRYCPSLVSPVADYPCPRVGALLPNDSARICVLSDQSDAHPSPAAQAPMVYDLDRG